MRLAFAVTVVSLVMGAPPVRAESDAAEAQARALFREGRDLAHAGRYEEACPRFEVSLKLHGGLGTEFNLADCREHLGQDMRARDLFVRVADRARELGQAEREKVARERAAALEATAIELAPAAHGASTDDLSTGLQAEYGVLAELSAAVLAVKTDVARLEGGGPAGPRARKLRAAMAALEDQLADAWHAAGRVTAELAATERTSPAHRVQMQPPHAERVATTARREQ